jgi:hypothetical protein
MLRMVDSLLLFVLYVDDLLIIGCSTSVIAAVNRILHDRVFDYGHGSATLFPWTQYQSGCIRHQTVSGKVCMRSP